MVMRTVALAGLLVVVIPLSACATVSAAHAGAPAPAPHGAPASHVISSLIQPPLRILIVGDSLTVGAFASSPAHTAYAPLVVAGLRAAHPARAVDATIVAHGGYTAALLLALAAPPLVPTDATYDDVVVEAGTNDYFYGTGITTFAAQYTALVASLAGHLPRAGRLVCLSPWEPPQQINRIGLHAPDYTAVISAVCRAAHPGAALVDLPPLCATPGDIAVPGAAQTHPDDQGYAAIARLVLAALA